MDNAGDQDVTELAKRQGQAIVQDILRLAESLIVGKSMSFDQKLISQLIESE